jgi:hypothetical protein
VIVLCNGEGSETGNKEAKRVEWWVCPGLLSHLFLSAFGLTSVLVICFEVRSASSVMVDLSVDWSIERKFIVRSRAIWVLGPLAHYLRSPPPPPISLSLSHSLSFFFLVNCFWWVTDVDARGLTVSPV